MNRFGCLCSRRDLTTQLIGPFKRKRQVWNFVGALPSSGLFFGRKKSWLVRYDHLEVDWARGCSQVFSDRVKGDQVTREVVRDMFFLSLCLLNAKCYGVWHATYLGYPWMFLFVAVSVDRSAWCCLLATYHATPWDESSVTVVFEEVLSDVLGHGQVSSNMQLVLAGCRKPQGWLNYGKFDEWIEPHGCAFFVLKNVHPWQLGWNSPKSCTLQNKKYIQLCIS